jgi:hypothetical protein
VSNHFFQDRQVKAAKEYTCEACGLSIESGELHLYQAGVFYEEFFSRRVHRFCWEIWEKSTDHEELGDFRETLQYWLEEHLEPEEVLLLMEG